MKWSIFELLLGVVVSFFRPKSEGYDHSLNAPGWEASTSFEAKSYVAHLSESLNLKLGTSSGCLVSAMSPSIHQFGSLVYTRAHGQD
jgi:hypothetical protein